MSESDDLPQPALPGQTKVQRVYIALIAALLLGFVPSVSFAALSVALFLVVWIAAYIIRSKAEDDSLIENHMTFVIRSLWIVSLIAVITLIIGSTYLITGMTAEPLMQCVGGMEGGAAPGYDQFRTMVQPCMDEFLAANRSVLAIAGTITILPVVVYLLIRIARGFGRARKGQKLENVKRVF